MKKGALVRSLFPALTLGLLLAACGGPEDTSTPVTALTDTGAGSLRQAIADAKAGDTLKFTTTGTVTLDAPIKTDKNLTIIATGVTLDAAGKGRVLEVPAGVTVTVQGGTLKGGVGQVLSTSSLNQTGLSNNARGLSLDSKRSSLTAQASETYGGIILNRGALTLDSTSVTGGKADYGAGVFNATGATLTISGTASVTGNTASLNSGGILNQGNLTLTGGSVSGNTSYYGGAGVGGSIGSTMTMSGGNIDNNTCTFPVTVDNSNQATGCAGGGIYSNGSMTISGGSVSGNTVSYFGAGVTVQRTTDTSGNAVVPKLTVSGSTIANNTISDATRGGGGGIWVDGDFTMTGGTVSGNTGVYGGGLGIQGNSTITGGTVEGNTGLAGGGVFAYQPASRSVTLTFGGSAVVRGNTATDSSGGLGIQAATLNMTGGTVQDNTAKYGGGGIAFGGGTVSTISGGSISGNKLTDATGAGGGIRLFTGSGSASVTMSGGQIKDNTALKDGGGVLISNKATFKLTGGTISGNSVTGTDATIYQGFGGGVRLYAGATFNASGGTIQNNTASVHGGGVFIGGPDTANSTPAGQFTMSGSTSITGNKATAGAGGGVVNGGTYLLQGGTISGNTSAQAGGGVRNWKGTTFTQSGGSVTGNTPDNIQTDQ